MGRVAKTTEFLSKVGIHPQQAANIAQMMDEEGLLADTEESE